MVSTESSYNDADYTPGDVWEIDHGYDVFAADGEKVGDVQEVHPYYLVVSKGFFFPTERYVPVSAITDVHEERVSLNVTKDQIDNEGWDTIPDEPTFASDYSDTTFNRTGVDQTTMNDTLINERSAETVDDGLRIPVREEELSVNKREVRRGLVRVNKTVTEQEASVNVPLREETVHVERHAVSGNYSDDLPTDAFHETEIEIPLRGEEADVSKRTVVREEVTIGKNVVERDQQISDTLRREEVSVDGADAVTGVTDTAGADPGEGRLGRLEDKLDPSPNEGGKPRGI